MQPDVYRPHEAASGRPHKAANQNYTAVVRTCSVDGCDRRHLARGWCHTHYKRWQTTGDAQPDMPIIGRVEGDCTIEGCDRPRHRRLWCSSHYYRWRGTGDVQPDRPILTTTQAAAAATAALELPPGSNRINGNGYVVRKLHDDDPHIAMASQTHGRWVLEHRYVMAASLGRDLNPAETVHHINGDRTDNRLDNLELWGSRHPKGQRAADPHCPTCTCREE